MELEIDPNLIYEATIDKKPNDADIAIVPVNDLGAEGRLNSYVLKEYNYDISVLKGLDLSRGFCLLQGKGKKNILFVVTVSEDNTAGNLAKNLRAGILENLYFFSAKKAWLPLIGTGEGQLSILHSFEITKKVLESLSADIFRSGVFFWIAFPASASKEFTNINISYVSNAQSLGLDSEKFIGKFEGDFYLVGSSWGDVDKSFDFFTDGIWEDGDKSRGSELIEKVNNGDIVFLKSAYQSKGISYLRIKGIGVVIDNPRAGGILHVDWKAIYDDYVDIEHLGKYRSTFARVMPNDLSTIINAVGIEDVADMLLESSAFAKNGGYSSSNHVNTISIAGFLNDTEDGVDYLNIKKDVQAFARVIAAKNFQPPLAIALFGKWGSGKSFFMRKLKKEIELLPSQDNFDTFSKGVVHIHFNAWSYVDANLWASIITRIFEGLNEYITSNTASTIVKKAIEEKLTKELTITKEEIAFLTSQKESVEKQIKGLNIQKEALKGELQNKISEIKTQSLAKVINEVNEKYKAREKIEAAFNSNSSYVNSRKQLKNVVPQEYWDSPEKAYREAKSSQAFIREFFRKDKLAINILLVVVLLLIILFVPDILALFSDQIAKADFTFPQTIISLLIVCGGLLTRFKAVYKDLEPLVTSLWNIKENFQKQVKDAVSQFEQDEKRLKLEISVKESELQIVDKHIQQANTLKTDLDFKINNALATEALYGFIEKRCNTEDYKKYLGIVSTIRKDFEILSGLFSDHQEELKTLGLKKPIERIVLYIDDLDRCPEENVVQVLEAVNLLMAYPLFIVVVGVDPLWINNALMKKHSFQFENEKIRPSDYLEKIFQVAFYLKDANQDSIKEMIENLAQPKPIITTKKEAIDERLKDHLMEVGPSLFPIESSISDVYPEEAGLVGQSHESMDVLKEIEISKNEIQLMQTLISFIGTNPRGIKRFVNTYRIIKAHEDFPINAKESDRDVLAIMFLLALPIGPFKKLMPAFAVSVRQGGIGTLKGFSQSMPDEKEKNAFYAKLILHENRILIDISIQVFKKYLDFVERFTFREV